ncbi:MAG: hypothetical protein JWO30_3272 [Fibrobacteres bacterium]|nr:hypothetical protein [Fibrobacterota bacterium]
MKLLWRTWRTAATLMCFAIFALGGATLGLFGIPLVWLVWRKEESRHRVGRIIIQRGFHLFVLLMRITGVLHVRYEGLEALRRSGNLVLANHPTLIDFVLLASVIPQADCFVKSALLNDWFKRWPVLLAGYIRNDEGESTMARCRKSLDSGNNVIIFPEGTRTPPGMPVKFRKGAAQVAVRTRQNVTPVVIESTRSNLHKGGAWYLAPEHRMRIVLRVKDDIPISPFLKARPDQPALAARDLNDHLQYYFNKDLCSAGA